MTQLHLRLCHGEWQSHEDNGTCFQQKGQIFVDQSPRTIGQVAQCVQESATAHALKASLNQFNGFYAWVEQSPGFIRAAVDHIRSLPLFYACVNGHFHLSDDAEWVRQKAGDREMDPVSRQEFQLAGYVTGADTLFPHVKQLQAGEFLVAEDRRGGVHVQPHRYCRFLHAEPEQVDTTALLKELDGIAIASITRLIAHADGRQIVVPLSGGYDSRLIVTLLKRLGYENVCSFSYGLPGNKEATYSKRVADALGLRWHFVKYNDERWREAWAGNDRKTYQQRAAGWTSIPHVQDWLAVKCLKEQNVLEPDCVFAPGHGGDFVAGSHIPKQARRGAPATLSQLTEATFSNHYRLARFQVAPKPDKAFWANRILDRAERWLIEDGVTLADAMEKWDWQERQAKFICNSVRVYEFYGYDWWMPLWDVEFMRFWEHVPLELRKGTALYLTYVRQETHKQDSTGTLSQLTNASDPGLLTKMAVWTNAVSSPWILNYARSVRRVLSRALGNDPRRAFPGGIHILNRDAAKHAWGVNGMLAYAFLKDIDDSMRCIK
jgi:asparagine synthase (glutamine-hydrolysing)